MHIQSGEKENFLGIQRKDIMIHNQEENHQDKQPTNNGNYQAKNI